MYAPKDGFYYISVPLLQAILYISLHAKENWIKSVKSYYCSWGFNETLVTLKKNYKKKAIKKKAMKIKIFFVTYFLLGVNIQNIRWYILLGL